MLSQSSAAKKMHFGWEERGVIAKLLFLLYDINKTRLNKLLTTYFNSNSNLIFATKDYNLMGFLKQHQGGNYQKSPVQQLFYIFALNYLQKSDWTGILIYLRLT